MSSIKKISPTVQALGKSSQLDNTKTSFSIKDNAGVFVVLKMAKQQQR